MSKMEEILVGVLAEFHDPNAQAILLHSFIQEYGFLSEEAAAEVRRILAIKYEPYG